MKAQLHNRLERERKHSHIIIATDEKNWGWRGEAGQIRWRRRLDYLAGALPCGEGKVLEIGAGTGTFTESLARLYADLTAIDISPELLAVAARKAPRASLLCMDAHNLEFPDNSFDAIVGCSVLHHLEWPLALASFFRKLKPNGVIRFSEPNLLNPQIFVQKNIPWIKGALGDSPDEYAFTARRIARDLTDAGYTAIQVAPYEFLHPSIPRRLIPAVLAIEQCLERSLCRHIAGSLRIEARKPPDRQCA